MVGVMIDLDKPLAYVLGNQPFHPLSRPLLVRPPTLIPRPETEHWVSVLASRILSAGETAQDEPFRLLDIGTGTGCIALALTAHLRAAGRAVHATAADRAHTALSLAEENATQQSLSSLVSIREADLFSPSFANIVTGSGPGGTHEQFSLVVSNPPYITRAEYSTLEASVRAWEDRGALVGEYGRPSLTEASGRMSGTDVLDDGIVFYRRIVSLLDNLLVQAPSSGAPVVAFEVGQCQARAVERLLLDWRGQKGRQLQTEVVKDPWGVERAVFAK